MDRYSMPSKIFINEIKFFHILFDIFKWNIISVQQLLLV